MTSVTPSAAALSVVTSAVSSSSSSTTSSKLVELANGEYTAASVSADQTDATKLGLEKEKDGNYGTQNPSSAKSPSAVATTGSTAASASAGVQSALTSQTLGGD